MIRLGEPEVSLVPVLRIVAVLLVLGSALQVAGCSSDDPPAGSRPRIDYELFETTVEVGPETLAALTEASDERLVFAGQPAALDGVVRDTILLGGITYFLPSGLLRRVVSVDRSGPDLVIATAPATVFHAFRRLDVEATMPFQMPVAEAQEIAPETFPGGRSAADEEADVSSRREAITVSVSLGDPGFSKPLTDGDGLESSAEDRVQADGKMVATAALKFWLSFDWADKSAAEALSELDDLLEDVVGLFTGTVSLGALLDLRTGFTIDGDLDVSLAIVGKSSLAFEREDQLSSVILTPPITIGPLVFVPSLSLVSRVSGGITGELEMGFGVGADLGVGFSYDADEDYPKPYLSGPSFSSMAPSATVSSLANIRAELELRVNLMLYGFAGPYASIIAYGDVDLDHSRDPCWQLTAGLQGGAGASIGVFDQTLASIAIPSFTIGDPLDLGGGSCLAPPEPPPTDAVITPWSRSYGDTLWGTGTDDGFTNLDLAHDGRLLMTSAGSEVVMKVAEDGTPTWARTLDQPDRPGVTVLWPQHAVPMLDTGVLVSTQQNVLVKLSASGEPIWGAQIESDTDEDGFRAMKQIDGRIWLAGTYRPIGTSGSDDRQALLILLAPNGLIERAWTWGVPEYREAVRGILPLSDGALLVGEAVTFAGTSRSFVLRAEANGDLRWAKHIEGCDGDEPTLVGAIETGEGNFILHGWFYATETRALLLRINPDGTDAAPAWATETAITPILGLEPTSVVQLSTGELRVAGSWAKIGDDRVFVAGTDATGRFAWARWYGGEAMQGHPTARVTSQGGLMIGATSAAAEPEPGGFWLFEVPMSDGVIDFAAGSGVTSEPLAFTSTAACLTTPDAATATTPFAVGLTEVEVTAAPMMPVVHVQ